MDPGGREWPVRSVEADTHERWRGRLGRVAWGAAATGLLSFVGGVVLGSWFGDFVFDSSVAWFGGALAVALVRGVWPRAPTIERALLFRLEPDAAVLEGGPGARRIARVRIAQGFLLEPSTLGLVLDDGEELFIELSEREDAEEALDALALGATDRPLEVPLISLLDQGTSDRRIATMLAAAWVALPMSVVSLFTLAWLAEPAMRGRASVLGMLLASVLVAVTVVIDTLFYRAVRRAIAKVGADGITIPSLAGSRFVPYGAIARVEEDERGVVLITIEGERLELPVTFLKLGKQAALSARAGFAKRAMILDRIRQARARAGSSGVPEAKLARLDRAGRTKEAWRAALAGLGRSDYRTDPFTPEELAHVALDTGASPERRAAATVALRVVEAPELARVRVAADACLDEDLKVALERAAEGELETAALTRATARLR